MKRGLNMEKDSKNTPPIFRKRFWTNKMVLYILLLLIIVLTVWISFLQFRTPKVVPYNGKSGEFSAERAMDYVENIAKKPRPLGSAEHDRVRDYLLETLTRLGISPEIQKKKQPDGSVVENIIARIPGQKSTSAIMISAHYDTVDGSPGAADNGSGVSAILETVRILSNTKTLKNDVVILLSDGEESGLLGARAFVSDHPWASEVGIVFNFEARGSMGPSILFETSEGNDRLIEEFVKSTPNPIAHSFFYDIYRYLPHETDLNVFKEAGMYGLNFGFYRKGLSYHSAIDTPENLSIASLQHHGEYMIDLVQHFGKLNLVAKEEGNRIYFNLLGKKIITYSEKLVVPLMVIAIISFIGTFLHGHLRKKLTIVGTTFSFFLFLLALGLLYKVSEGLWMLTKLILAENVWVLETGLLLGDIVFIVYISIILMIFAFIYQLAAKKIQICNLTMGAHFGWLILVIISSVFFKGSSYIFLLPYAFGIISLNILMCMKYIQTFTGFIISIGFTIPILLLTSSVIYLIYTLFTFNEIAYILPFVVMIGAFMIPVLNTIQLGNPVKSKSTSQEKELTLL